MARIGNGLSAGCHEFQGARVVNDAMLATVIAVAVMWRGRKHLLKTRATTSATAIIDDLCGVRFPSSGRRVL